ncbi:MAG: hypothetical protein RBT49_11855 [Bacteroidales bacterium]|jgi:hypothetical protein|nr:hypothetical protein [Bacteroidales bacterium]
MKKFVSDNIVWFVLAAVALSAYAVYTVTKKPAEETPADAPAA